MEFFDFCWGIAPAVDFGWEKAVERVTFTMDLNFWKSRFIAYFIRRGWKKHVSELEQLHDGKFPSSKTGKFDDVKVVTPYGEIPWNELSRISDKEMRKLMLDIELMIRTALATLDKTEAEIEGAERFKAVIQETLKFSGGISWDLPDELRRG